MYTTLTDEQKKKRLGKFTASEIHKIMGARGLGKTGETYIYEKAAEFLTGESKSEVFAPALDWGIKHELEAQIYFEHASGLKIEKLDIIDNGIIAGTPDGMIKGEHCGFEIKCPFNSANHLKNLTLQDQSQLKSNHADYYWQITSYMWLTGFNQWKYCSYDPRFKEEKRMLILNIELNKDDLNHLHSRCIEAKEIFDSIIKNIA